MFSCSALKQLISFLQASTTTQQTDKKKYQNFIKDGLETNTKHVVDPNTKTPMKLLNA